MPTDPIRELTGEERATWGECPICHAGQGELCTYPADLGIPPHEGAAHAARLRAAPMQIGTGAMKA